MNAQIDSLS